jgi:hypothetical protein
MRQSQLEIKSIEAELKSIRANTKSPQSVSLLEAGGSSQPSLPESLNQLSQSTSIAPTITPTSARQPTTDHHQTESRVQSKPKREVECFPFPTQSIQPDAMAQAQLESVIQQLRRVSDAANQGTRRQSPRQARRRQAASQANAIRQLLEEKAKQINDLSTQQETAILELMKISGQLNQEHQAADIEPELKNELALECEIAEIPYIERDRNGILVLTNRSIDAKSRRESTTAKVAKPPIPKTPRQRYRSRNRTHLLGRFWQWIAQPVLWLGAVGVGAVGLAHSGERTRHQGYRGSGRRAVTAAPEMPVTLKEAATLVIGSALLRILLDWVVISYPMLWIPSILVMITPAAFAIYRATVKPPTGFAWGYRLFAILIGLLLGGRL